MALAAVPKAYHRHATSEIAFGRALTEALPIQVAMLAEGQQMQVTPETSAVFPTLGGILAEG
jgi:hypothetical protein